MPVDYDYVSTGSNALRFEVTGEGPEEADVPWRRQLLLCWSMEDCALTLTLQTVHVDFDQRQSHES